MISDQVQIRTRGDRGVLNPPPRMGLQGGQDVAGVVGPLSPPHISLLSPDPDPPMSLQTTL